MTDTPDLWARLQDRAQPTVVVAIPQDPAGYQAAQERVEEARRAQRDALARGVLESDVVETAEEALATQPVIEFTIRALTAGEWDALVAQHPPTPEQRKQGWQWDTGTFRPALLAEAVTPAMSEHHWHVVTEQGQLGMGELDLLFAEAINLSNRALRVAVGKG